MSGNTEKQPASLYRNGKPVPVATTHGTLVAKNLPRGTYALFLNPGGRDPKAALLRV